MAADLGPGGELAPERDQEAYRRRMARRQEVQRQRVGERNLEKGLVLVFTGDGKGKTTAALGLVLRTLGHGESVAVVQFIKGGWQPGEAKALELFGDALAWHALGRASPGKPRTASATVPWCRPPGSDRSATWATPAASWWCSMR